MEENEKITMVPYVVYEGAMARAERHAKRLFIALICSVIALVGCNVAWLVYESQFNYDAYSVDLSAETGNANFIGNDGTIINGETESSTSAQD